HGLRAGRKQRGLRLEVKGLRPARHVRRRGQKLFLSQQPCESDTADPHRITCEEVAAGPGSGSGASVQNHFHAAWSGTTRNRRQMKLKTVILEMADNSLSKD